MFIINYANSIKSKKFKQVCFETPDAVLDWFEDKGVQQLNAKEDAEVIVFGEFEDQQKSRVKDNLVATRFIVLDIDRTNEAEMEGVLAVLMHYYYVLYDTYSSTDDAPRLRLIILLDHSVSYAEYAVQKLGSRLAVFAGIAEIDVVSDRPVQAYYVPSSPIGVEGGIIINKGKKGCLPLSVLTAVKLPAKKVAKQKSLRKQTKGQGGKQRVKEIAEVKRIVEEHFNGHLMFVNNRFWVFVEGIWGAVTDAEMVQFLLLDVYEEKQELMEVQAVVKYMKSITCRTEFPQCQRKNGVIVLESCAVDPLTGKKLKHNPKYYAKNKQSFDYDSEATCPQWLTFLDQVFRDDKDKAKKIALLQEFTGLSLTPNMHFQKMLWLIGAGSNGKGVIFDIVRELIGPENCSALPIADFKQRFGLEQLEHKLANFDPEMTVSAVLADSKIKSVVGGDVVSLERKMEPVYQARLHTKLWAAANALPITKDTSYGFFRRVLILTFNRVFSEQEQDKQLTAKLREELPGIFNWALKGLHRLLENNGFTVPESSIDELDEYRVTSDNVERFKREHLMLLDGSVSVRQGKKLEEIYSSYVIFCRANGMYPLNSSKFGQQLKALGIIKRKSGNHRYYPVELKNMGVYQADSLTHKPSPRLMSIEDAFDDVA